MGYLPQCFVARTMTVPVVVLLEIIDVYHRQAKGDAASLDMSASLLECMVKTATVGYPGQGILQRETLQLLTLLHQFKMITHSRRGGTSQSSPLPIVRTMRVLLASRFSRSRAHHSKTCPAYTNWASRSRSS